MKILIVTSDYPPEIRSASKLVYDLRNHLIDIGYETDVVTTNSKYNIDKNWEYADDTHVSTPVRVNVFSHHNVSYYLRGLSQLFMPFQFMKAIRKHLNKKYDLVIIYSPPLTLGLVGVLLKMKWNTTTVLNIQDLFPQNAIDLGILRNKLLIYLFKYIEKVCYQKNDWITFHSASNLKFISKMYPKLTDSKSLILHNWQKFPEKLKVNNSYVYQKYGIDKSKKIAIFAGVLGPAQGLNKLIQLAKNSQLKNNDWHFLILGNGAEKEALIKQILDLKLQNIKIENFVSPDEYEQILSGCHAGMVFLSEYNKTPVVPGKILGYMASKKPVFCVLNKESDAHDMIKAAKCGKSTISSLGDNEIADAFDEFCNRNVNLHQQGSNGYNYALKHYSIDKIVQRLFQKIQFGEK